MTVRHLCAIVIATFCALVLTLPVSANPVAESGRKGGVVVHLDCGDGALTVELGADPRTVVHGLDTDAAKVEKARAAIHKAGRYGLLSASVYDGKNLPYIDNLINMVVCEGTPSVSNDEIMRVLAPLGTLRVKTGSTWKVTQKPWPAEIDEWNQYLHGADNNAVSRDTVVGPPRHLRWVTNPNWSRSHMTGSTVNSLVTARGRLITIEDKSTPENPFLPGRFSLVARDAFNGTVMWEYPFESWEPVTRYIKDISVQMQRRVVAVDDTVYSMTALDSPVTLFDAATGDVIRTLDATNGSQEFGVHQGVVFAVVGDPMNSKVYDIVKAFGGKGLTTGGTDPNAPFDGTGFPAGYAREARTKLEPKCKIVAVDGATGKVKWESEEISKYVGASLAMQDDVAVYLSNAGVRCLDVETGKEHWFTPADAPIPPALMINSRADTLVIRGKYVFATRGGMVTSYTLRDGHKRWTTKSPNVYEKTPDFYVVHGVPWTGGSGFPTSHDPETGEPTKTYKQVMTKPMGHDRCYRNFITERFYINSKTGGADFVDLATGLEFPNHWTRGTCGMGVIPANGMLYTPPFSCQCSMGSMVPNFNAYYTEPNLAKPDQMIEVERAERLVKGPAFGKVKATDAGADDWATYRRNVERTGSMDTTVPAKLKEMWKASFTGTPSAPVIAAGMVFVSDVDAHTIRALNADDGKTLWTHTAGGRVDTPPTYHKGTVLFGSRDGWVTCLRASDGAQVWSFKDLPDRMIGAFGQLESVWPVNGAVLVKDDVVYFNAGRSSYLDGGIFVYALDAATGAVKHSRGIYGPFEDKHGHPKPSGKGDSAQDAGFKGDVMVAKGDVVYARHKGFLASDLSSPAKGEAHLVPSAGFLDGTPQHRTYWSYGTEYAFTAVKGVPDCDILVADGGTYYGVGGFRTSRHSYFDPRKSGYRLMSGPVASGFENTAWTTHIPLTGHAMVKTGAHIFVAGTPMKFDGHPLRKIVDSYERRLGGTLWVASSADGTPVAEYALDAAPAWDGMAAANGNIYISLKDGTLRCLASSKGSAKAPAQPYTEDQINLAPVKGQAGPEPKGAAPIPGMAPLPAAAKAPKAKAARGKATGYRPPTEAERKARAKGATGKKKEWLGGMVTVDFGNGMVLTTVPEKSDLYGKGFRQGDRATYVNETKVENGFQDFQNIIKAQQGGITFTVVRDGKEIKVPYKK